MNEHRDTPDSIAAARRRLAAARESLRDRPLQQTLASLCALLDRWHDPRSGIRRELEAELPKATGMHPATVREGLQRALERYSGRALRELVARDLPALERTQASGFEQTSVLLAGSIPMPSLVSLLLPLVVHSPVLAKTASRDPLTARLFEASLAELDPELAGCLEVVSFPGGDEACTEAFLDTGCLVASGSDETIAALRTRLRPSTRLVAYGHRLSLVAVGPEALRGEELAGLADRLAVDVALWDQLGCLSPVAILCESPDRSATQALAAALAASLEAAEQRWPRGDVPDDARAAIRQGRDEALMRRAAGRDVTVHADRGTRWTVVCEDDLAWRPAPLYRFVRVQPAKDRSSLLAAIADVSAHLAAVGMAGFGDETPEVARATAALGASRICAPGSMQTPPLGWHHDGQSPLHPLTRLTDIEIFD